MRKNKYGTALNHSISKRLVGPEFTQRPSLRDQKPQQAQHLLQELQGKQSLRDQKPQQALHLLLQEECGKPRILDQKPKHALHLFPPRTMGRATRDHRLHLLTCLCPQGDVGVSGSVGA